MQNDDRKVQQGTAASTRKARAAPVVLRHCAGAAAAASAASAPAAARIPWTLPPFNLQQCHLLNMLLPVTAPTCSLPLCLVQQHQQQQQVVVVMVEVASAAAASQCRQAVGLQPSGPASPGRSECTCQAAGCTLLVSWQRCSMFRHFRLLMRSCLPHHRMLLQLQLLTAAALRAHQLTARGHRA